MTEGTRREWGLALGSQAQDMIIDIIGMSFIPMYTVRWTGLFCSSCPC
jgi:hypothetical protein